MLPDEFNTDQTLREIDMQLISISTQYFHSVRDVDDLRQDIFVVVMESAREYKPALAAWSTFQQHVIRAAVENFLMGKRWLANQAHESIDELDEPRINDVRFAEMDIFERVVFSIELDDVVRTMPERLQLCCEHLKHYSMTETAEMLKISRRTLLNDMQKIKTFLSRAKMTPDIF